MNTPDDNFMYYYAFTGYFVKNLIERFGINIFKDFYREINRNMDYENIDKIFTKYFGINIVKFTENI